jgi:hypothetical protein
MMMYCTFSGNNATAMGGGIYNMYSSPTMENVTISGNTASVTGGGMMNFNSANPTLINVTISGNSSQAAGGIYDSSNSNPTLMNVTISTNLATINGGGLVNNNSHPVIRDSLIWGNTAMLGGDQIYDTGGSTPTVSDSIVQGGYAGGTNILTTDPHIGALGMYGGFLQTVPLLPGSSAIDTGNATYCTWGSDARGRVYLGACDIGAYESRGFTLEKTGGDNQINPINTAFPNPLSLTVTPNSAGEPVDGGVVTFTAPATGASTQPPTTPVTISGGAALLPITANGAPGPYLVIASANGATSVDFSLTNQIVPTLTVTNSPVTYTGAPQAAAVSPSVLGTVSNIRYDGSLTVPTDAGNYTVTADFTPIDAINYASLNAAAAGSFVIATADQAALTVTATPSTVVYGSTAALGVSGGSGTGGVSFSTGSSTGCSVSGSTLSVTDSSGTCSVTATGAGDSNYNPVTSAPLAIPLAPKALTIGGLIANAKPYDGVVAATLIGTPALGGVVSPDSVTLGGSPVAAFGTPGAGPAKPVTVTGFTIGGDVDNYTLTQPSGLKADINPRILTVSANDQTVMVGSPDPTFDYTVDGFVSPDDFSNAPTCAVVENPHTAVDVYTIACSAGDAGPNYDLHYVDAQFTVTGKPILKVTAPSFTFTYGDALPALTPQYDGFANQDGAGVLNTAPTCSAGDGPFTPVGSPYTVTCSGGADNHYAFDYVAGSLTVSAKPVTITPDAGQNKAAGVADPVFTYTHTPLVGADVLTGNLGRAAGEAMGAYAYTLGTLAAGGNYNLSLAPETFTITAPQDTTRVLLTSSREQLFFGESWTLTATVAAGSSTPTGTVTFKDGATILGTGDLADGSATLTLTSLSVGSHTITAEYNGIVSDAVVIGANQYLIFPLVFR